MMQRGEEPIAAAQVLLPVYESAGDWPKVAAVYEVMIAATQEPVRRSSCLTCWPSFTSAVSTISMRRLMPTVARCGWIRRTKM